MCEEKHRGHGQIKRRNASAVRQLKLTTSEQPQTSNHERRLPISYSAVSFQRNDCCSIHGRSRLRRRLFARRKDIRCAGSCSCRRRVPPQFILRLFSRHCRGPLGSQHEASRLLALGHACPRPLATATDMETMKGRVSMYAQAIRGTLRPCCVHSSSWPFVLVSLSSQLIRHHRPASAPLARLGKDLLILASHMLAVRSALPCSLRHLPVAQS